jgi:hypothetical protein
MSTVMTERQLVKRAQKDTGILCDMVVNSEIRRLAMNEVLTARLQKEERERKEMQDLELYSTKTLHWGESVVSKTQNSLVDNVISSKLSEFISKEVHDQIRIRNSRISETFAQNFSKELTDKITTQMLETISGDVIADIKVRKI